MKFEKGKKVRIVGNESEHGFEIGNTVKMVSKCSYIGFDAVDSDGEYWSVYYSDCEEIEESNDKPERYKSREVHGLDVIDLVNYWGLNFQEANILKYLLRDKGEDESDLEKIIDYAQRELKRLRDCK